MPDYSKSKIYTIRFIENDNNIYIGSTTQPLAVRFGGHKRILSILYKHIQEKYNGDWSKCYIELYEELKCDNKEQLMKREGEVIRDFIRNNEYEVLNIRIEGRTRIEYYEDNKEKMKEYKQNNKEKFKEYYENNKERFKGNHKKYYNKEESTERKNDYRQRIRIYDFLELIKNL